jgi:hypothetical protein
VVGRRSQTAATGNYETKPCVRRASLKFRVQGSKFAKRSQLPNASAQESKSIFAKRTHSPNPKADYHYESFSHFDVYNDFTKRTHSGTEQKSPTTDEDEKFSKRSHALGAPVRSSGIQGSKLSGIAKRSQRQL